MSSNLEVKKESAATESSQWCWQRLSPNHLDHRQRFPTAITLHRLVPHPPPVLHQADNATISTYKYITPEEIKAAQIKARQEILASKQVSPPHPPPADTRTPASSKKKKKRQCHHRKECLRSQSLFSCRLDSGEAGLRRRQLTRLLSQISQTLRDLQVLKIPSKKDFVTPLDLEIKRRHWAEYVRSMRRSLFVLKQEVVLLEGNCANGKKCSQYLRALAATARTLNIQVMALKSHAESSSGELGWKEAFREFLGVAHRVLLLAANVGVQLPPSSLKWTKSSQEGIHHTLERGSGLELDDSASVPLLKSEHVRKRLASLAALHLKRKNKEGDGKVTRGASANKIPSINPKPAAPKVNGPASQSLKIDLPVNPKPLLSHSNISNPQLHHVNNHTNVSAVQPQPSLFPSDVSFPQHHQPLPPQNDNAEAPQLPFSSHERNNIMSQPSHLAPDFMQQLSFLLERVCTIENKRRRTEALISEAPKTYQSSSGMPSLHSAVQQAKLVLASVRGSTSYSQVPLPQNGVSYTSSAPIISSSTGLSFKISEECSGGTTSHPIRHDHRAEVIGEATSQYGIKWMAEESVTEQVRRQKEKFWLSLAKQGFVRPPETLLRSEGSGDGASEAKAGEKLASTLKKAGALNELMKSSASQAELHHQTFESITKQSQCLIMNEKDSSHLNSNTCSRIQQDISDKHSRPSVSAGSRIKDSPSTERQLQQNMSVNNTSSSTTSSSDSQSFPSYEGISSPE